MRKPTRWLWQTLVPYVLFVVCMVVQGCSCNPSDRAIAASYAICKGKHAPSTIAALLTERNVVFGRVAINIGVSGTGALEATIPLVCPGSADDDLRVTYDGENDGPSGFGFGINGASVVQRCNKTMALDGKQSAIQFDVETIAIGVRGAMRCTRKLFCANSVPLSEE